MNASDLLAGAQPQLDALASAEGATAAQPQPDLGSGLPAGSAGITDESTNTLGEEGTPEGELPAAKSGEEGAAGAAKGQPKEDVATLNALLEKEGVQGGLDGLKTTLEKLNELTSLLGDRDPKVLLEKASKMDEVSAAWEIQERIDREKELRANETAEETVRRHDRELEEREAERQQASQREAERLQVYDNYDKRVSETVDSVENLDKATATFLKSSLASTNEINHVNPRDPAAVAAMTKRYADDVQKFRNEIIQEYVAGKIKLPNIGSSESGASSGSGDDSVGKPNNIQEATSLIGKNLSSFFPNFMGGGRK